MDLPSLSEMISRIDEIISALDQDENRFYIIIDLAHQLREELHLAISVDPEDSD